MTLDVSPSDFLDNPSHSALTTVSRKQRVDVTDLLFGAVGDGVTVNTVAIQAAHDLAFTLGATLYFPQGDFLTGAINYKGVPLLGSSMQDSRVIGLASQDVFHADTTLAEFSRQRISIANLTVVVNDSVNAVASFPNRSGVGNAGFAWDYNDGSVAPPMKANLWSFENVAVEGLSGTSLGQNNSVGFFWQSGPNLCRFRNVQALRLEYGWWEDYPRVNTASVEIYRDHNNYDSLYANECTNSFKFVNNANNDFSNVTVHGAQSGGTGLEMTAVQSLTRGDSFNNSFSDVMIEDIAGAPWDVEGTNVHVKNMWIGNTAASSAVLTIASQSSRYEGLFVSTGLNTDPVIVITGNYNILDTIKVNGTTSATYGWNQIDDQGYGNRVDRVTYWSGSNSRNFLPVSLVRDGRQLHERDAAAVVLGHMDPPYVSGNDLLVNPLSIVPAALTKGTDYDYIQDTVADLGVALRVETPGGFFTNSAVGFLNGERANRVGLFLPESRLKVYVKAKADSATTQLWDIVTDPGTSRGAFTLNLTSSYQVFSWDIDLTGAALGDWIGVQVNNLASGAAAPLDVAWVAFRPYHKELQIADYIEGVEIADPAAPATNRGRIYFRDTGGKTELVCRFPTGVIQQLAIEP